MAKRFDCTFIGGQWLVLDYSRKKNKPIVFPLPFKIFLRYAIGGRLHSERLHIFRKFWCQMLVDAAIRGRHYGQPGPYFDTEEERLDQANIMIAKLKQEGILENDFRRYFESLQQWRHSIRLGQRRNATKASWTPKARRLRRLRKTLRNKKKSLAKPENPPKSPSA